MKLRELESQFHLLCFCQFHLHGRVVGAYLLKKGENICVRFGFSTNGVSPLTSQQQIELTMTKWGESINGFPINETLRIHHRSLPDDWDRQMELETRATSTDIASLQMLNYASQTRARSLALSGIRCNYRIDIFGTYTYRAEESREQDYLERLSTKFSHAYLFLKGERKKKLNQTLCSILEKAFNEGFLAWEHLLSVRMGLSVVPCSSGELWEYAWNEFNVTNSSSVPHLLTLREVDGAIVLEEKISNDLSPVSLLIRGELGIPSVPTEDYRWIHVRGKYVAALVLEERINGYANIAHQFSYLWYPFTQVHNCEVVWECQLSNSPLDMFNLQRLVRYQKSRAEATAKWGGHNVVADLEIEDSLEAQKKMIEGKCSSYLSIAYFIYRDTPAQLNEACQKLINAFPSGQQKLIREIDIVPQLWRNKQPFVWEALVDPIRRKTYMCDELPFPLVQNQPFEKRGLELIAKEGGQPTYLDFVGQHHGMLTVAKSRKGKSALGADKIFTALSYKIPSIVLDYGMADGRTTYSDLADLLGEAGANVEVAYTKHNLLEMPDVNHFSKEQQLKHLSTYQSFIRNAIETIILGSERETRFAKRVRAFIDYGITVFFDDPVIQKRYNAARQCGFGSTAWPDMPTPLDLLSTFRHVDPEDLGSQQIAQSAKDEVTLQLTAFLRTPLGQALSRPSEVKLDAPFLNFSLRGARNEDEAAVCALMAQAIALCRALSHPKSYLLVDEGSLLFENKGLVMSVAEMVVNGGKSGIFVDLLTQDIATIFNSVAGSKFKANLDLKLIGAIEESDIADLSHHLGKPKEVFAANANADFEPDNLRLCSHWLLLTEGMQLHVSHYPSPELLALVASNPQEQKARQRYFDAYSDPIEGIIAFARDYAQARRSGTSMETLFPSGEEEYVTVRS